MDIIRNNFNVPQAFRDARESDGNLRDVFHCHG